MRKNKKSKIKSSLCFVGTNSAGLSSKLESFDALLHSVNPSVFFIQETKFKQQGKIKTQQSKKYQIFEMNRKEKAGGGLAIGALEEVKPVWISEGDDDVEILVVEIEIMDMKIRCICAYGPQETDCIDRKEKFWAKLTDEVDNAKLNDCATIIQMDGNLWGGPEVVRNDPKVINNNGKLFKNFLRNNPQLTVGNNLDICEGSITRSRKAGNKVEKSILDFFIFCDLLTPFISGILIDESKLYALSSYSKLRGRIHSDHNTMVAKFNLEFFKKKPPRDEYFNFKNRECQKQFFHETNNTKEFSLCFENVKNVKSQGEDWFKKLGKFFHKSFKKVRFNGKFKESESNKLFEARRKLVQELKKCKDDTRNKLEENLSLIEKQITDSIAEENLKKIKENFLHLSNPDGLININGMWNLKRKLFPKNRESLPFAKQNFDGKLITSQEGLKKLYLDTFIHRLRSRPIKYELSHLKMIKEELFTERLKLAKITKSNPWKLTELQKVLKALKSNKSRDPHGLINELFKPGVLGKGLEESILILFNRIKEEISIPEFMKFANIVTIYKGKGLKSSLRSDRGIFLVNVMRSILMKLVYQEKYPIVDKSMSDSQIGARRNKNIRNHIFILNGVINEAVNRKRSIDILMYDYRQCFDTLWLDECINDLYDAGIQDDKLALIYEVNRKNKVAIKSPFGTTPRVDIDQIVLQGEVLGPLQCSVQIETFSKECIEEEKFMYTYKDIEIPPLSMIDDLACIADTGTQSVEINAYINAKTSIKKLQYGVDKCYQIHVGGSEHTTPDLFIDNWEERKINGDLKDVFTGKVLMEKREAEVYLGELISRDGKNIKNLMARKAKGHGIIKQILYILQNTCLGPYEIEASLILRSSLFLNGILTNSEVWYGSRLEDIKHLEQIDEILLRKVLETPSSTPKCMLYLETGCKPIRFMIQARRVNYLQYILKEDPSSLVSKFFFAQNSQSLKNDWALTCRQDLKDLDINLSLEEIKRKSKHAFISLVAKATTKRALNFLLEEKRN